MLPKENRLKKKKNFEKVIKQKEVFFSQVLGLKKTKNNLKVTRIGIVVGQKISKKAVLRNKIKRRLRHILRDNLEKIKKGYDLIFFTKKGIEKKEFSQLKKEITNLLKRAKIFQ